MPWQDGKGGAKSASYVRARRQTVLWLEYETCPMGPCIEVGPPSSGRCFDGYTWFQLFMLLICAEWITILTIWSHCHDALPKAHGAEHWEWNPLKPYTQTNQSLTGCFPWALSWWCELCLSWESRALQVLFFCLLLPSRFPREAHSAWSSPLASRLWQHPPRQTQKHTLLMSWVGTSQSSLSSSQSNYHGNPLLSADLYIFWYITETKYLTLHTTQGRSPWGSTTHKLDYRPVRWRQSLNEGFLFPGDSSLYEVEKKEPTHYIKPKTFLPPTFCLVGLGGHFNEAVKERALPSEEKTAVTQNFTICRLCRRL